MQSIWETGISLPQSNPLHTELHTPAVIIGGGLAGLLISYRLKQRGISSIVLEAATMCSGQTRHTTAKITSQHSLIYHNLISKFGEEKALQYAHANQTAIDDYESLIQTFSIDCDFKRLPAYLYSTVEDRPLILEYSAAKRLSLPAVLSSSTCLPFAVKAALRFDNQAEFHPLKFAKALAKELTIYEHTVVKTVKDHTVYTEHANITAEHIIFATHYPFLNVPGYFFMRMHQERSYVLALKNAMHLDGMYISIDENGLSWRNQDGCLLLGGSGHRTGKMTSGMPYEFLQNQAHKYFPDSQEIAAWSAQDCMTLDQIPYIGDFSPSTPDWYVATGFNKWGMTSSMVAANLLADAICGIEHPDAPIFSPQRFGISGVLQSLPKEGTQAVQGLTKELLQPPKELLENLLSGNGGIIKYDGQKAGAYKDEQGNVFLVSVKCPHLGCQLEWNPAEKSWDCPCHGSRFDYKGNRLDNPAQTNLKKISKN